MFGGSSSSRTSSRHSSTEDGYVLLDHKNMVSEEQSRTALSIKNVFQWVCLFKYDDAKCAVNMAFDSTLKQSGSTSHTSGLMTPLKPVIVNMIEKERDLVQSDLKKRGSIMKNIQTFGHNIAGRAYTPNSADRQVERLKADLKAIESDVNLSRSQNTLIKTVCKELDIYITARYINLHHHLISSFCKDGEIQHKESFAEDLKSIGEMSAEIQSDALSPLKEMLDYERSFIESLINCSNSLIQWDFVTSLLHLQTFQISHDAFVKGQKIRERSIAGSKKGAKEEYPELYKWFWRMYEMLLSKFTLYFSKTLFELGNKKSIRPSTTVQVVDYRAKLTDFCRKTRAHSATLLLNTTNITFVGHGCKLFKSQRPDQPQDYSDRFEVLHHTGKIHLHEPDPEDKKSIVFLYNDVITKNFQPYLYDDRKNKTYFLCILDENVFLSLTYHSKRMARETEISRFLDDFRTNLNFSKL